MVELIVVIVIAAIIVAFAVPSYQSVLIQDRMASEITDMSGDLQLARSAAVKEGVPVSICASADATTTTPTCSGSDDWSTGWIIFTDPASSQNYASGAGMSLLRVHAGLQGGDVLTGSGGTPGAFGGSVSAFTFNRMGSASSGAGVLSLHDSANTQARTRCAIVQRIGSVVINTESHNPGVCP